MIYLGTQYSRQGEVNGDNLTGEETNKYPRIVETASIRIYQTNNNTNIIYINII